MNRKEIKQSLQNSVNHWVPDVYSKVASVPVRKMHTQDWITQQEPEKQKKTNPLTLKGRLSPAFAVVVFLLFLGVVWWYWLRVDSVVAMDVNPSVELRLNRAEQVVGLRALNTEAKLITNRFSWRFRPVEDVVQQLVDSLVTAGYLREKNSFLLVSYQHSDKRRAEALRAHLNHAVTAFDQQASHRVYVQEVEGKKATEFSGKYGVSRGVMQLVLKVQGLCPQYSFDSLLDLDLKMLYWLLEHSVPSGVPADKPADPEKTPMPFLIPPGFDLEDCWDDDGEEDDCLIVCEDDADDDEAEDDLIDDDPIDDEMEDDDESEQDEKDDDSVDDDLIDAEDQEIDDEP